MAEDKSRSGDKLYTLTEVADKTGISMPTLQRYKKSYQSRIPSVGRGRKQRYPEAALPVFEQIKQENIGRRGRPRKSASAKPAAKGATRGRKKAAPAKAEKGGLLPLTAVAEKTGISYPTLVRYVKLHGARIPSEGKGRSRRYHPEAIEVFKQLRSESPRGRRRKKAGGAPAPKGRRRAAAAGAPAGGGDLGKRVGSLEKSQASLEKQIKALIKQLNKPLKVTINR
jgi:DNA-binding transcriptional MerR regulator